MSNQLDYDIFDFKIIIYRSKAFILEWSEKLINFFQLTFRNAIQFVTKEDLSDICKVQVKNKN